DFFFQAEDGIRDFHVLEFRRCSSDLQHFHFLWGVHHIARLPVDGMSASEMIEITHPDDREMMIKKWSLAVQGKQPYDIEYRVVSSGERRGALGWRLRRWQRRRRTRDA